jgi:hypothetical protein
MASISLRVDLPDTALAEYTEAIGTKLLVIVVLCVYHTLISFY